MTDIQYIDTDSDEFASAPKALRDAYGALKSRFIEIEKERDTYKGRAESSALGDALKEFKNPERVKQAMLADKVDALNSEAVTKWVEQNGDDYVRGAVNSATTTPLENAEEAEAHRRLAASGELKQPADLNKFDAAFQEIPENATPDQVRALFLSRGL